MNDIISQVKKSFIEKKQDLYEAIARDYKENNIKIEYNLLEEIIKNVVEEMVSINNKNKTVLAIYNGNTYLMLEIILRSLKCKNNTILITEGEKLYTNKKILDIIQNILTTENIILKHYAQVDLSKTLADNTLIDRIIYFGDVRNYRKLKENTKIETKYNGYGSISIYVEDEDEFEDELEEIEEYATISDLYICKYDEKIEDAIKKINKEGQNDICIILSKIEEKIKKFTEKINSTNILVNGIDKEIKHRIPQELFEIYLSHEQRQ